MALIEAFERAAVLMGPLWVALAIGGAALVALAGLLALYLRITGD